MTTSTKIEVEPCPFTVVGDNLVIEYDDVPEEETSAGGVVLPGAAIEQVRSSTATLVGIGDDAGIDANVGDRLVLHRHRFTKLELDDTRELYVGKPEHVIGIVR